MSSRLICRFTENALLRSKQKNYCQKRAGAWILQGYRVCPLIDALAFCYIVYFYAWHLHFIPLDKSVIHGWRYLPISSFSFGTIWLIPKYFFTQGTMKEISVAPAFTCSYLLPLLCGCVNFFLFLYVYFWQFWCNIMLLAKCYFLTLFRSKQLLIYFMYYVDCISYLIC